MTEILITFILTLPLSLSAYMLGRYLGRRKERELQNFQRYKQNSEISTLRAMLKRQTEQLQRITSEHEQKAFKDLTQSTRYQACWYDTGMKAKNRKTQT